jgi:hypothetical protein
MLLAWRQPTYNDNSQQMPMPLTLLLQVLLRNTSTPYSIHCCCCVIRHPNKALAQRACVIPDKPCVNAFRVEVVSARQLPHCNAC